MFYSEKYFRTSQEVRGTGILSSPSEKKLYEQYSNYVGSSLHTGRGFYTTIPIGYDEELRFEINCETNEELFLAIAALRDDSDKYQYFVTEEEMHWLNQNTWMPVGSFIFSYVDNYTDIDGKVHKATVEELISHFKHENKTS